MDKQIALKNLIDLDNIFRENKAPCWIQDGTLLGYLREKDFISHDLDTDMGMMFEDFSHKILEDSEKAGFKYTLLGYPESCLQVTFSRFDIRTDVFFFYSQNDYIYHSAFLGTKRIDYRYKKFNLKEVIFLGHKFLAPSNELDFIVTKYGENWMITDKNWSYAYSPKNHFISDLEINWNEQNLKIENWKNSEKKSKTKKVITYGTYDTFHYGHMELIRKAKKFGDELIVAISTDEFNSIKGKKSIFNFEQRLEWIKSLKYVDNTIPEESWTQKQTDISMLNIDILVMGDDWLDKFDYLECLVIYVKRTDHVSTTEIKKIIES